MPYMIEITEVKDYNNDGAEDIADVEYLLRNNNNTLTILDGDGDFRSEECIEFLKEADIVVTNPPFSLFREYVAQLMKYKKKYIIIGNKNAFTYKEIFPLFKDNKMWLGYESMSKDMLFDVSNDLAEILRRTKKEGSGYRIVDGVFKGRAPAVWLTNIDNEKRHENLILYKKYTPEEYPRYDNYDAINVDKTNEIPNDYDGVMGVPISFLNSYNPNQFEIIGGFNGYKECDYVNGLLCGSLTIYYDKNGKEKSWTGPTINRETKYFRILIKRRTNEN